MGETENEVDNGVNRPEADFISLGNQVRIQPKTGRKGLRSLHSVVGEFRNGRCDLSMESGSGESKRQLFQGLRGKIQAEQKLSIERSR